MNRFTTRRNVLRGAGLCLALPFMESLVPRGAKAQTQSAKRLITLYFPNGAAPQWWDDAPPEGTSVFGDGFTLNPIHAPLEPVKDKVLIVSHLGNYAFRGEPGLEPSHSRQSAAAFTCVDADAKGGQANIVNSISADQALVQGLGLDQVTQLASLQVGLGSRPGAFDGRNYAYNQVISWKSATEPLKRQINPKAIFDLLVASGATNSSAAAPDPNALREVELIAQRNQSVLDVVLEDATALRGKLSKVDQLAFEQFETAFREVEQQATRVGNVLTPLGCSVIAEPFAVPEPGGAMQGLNQGQEGYDRAAHAAVMNDLVSMAIQCDTTRVVSYMLDDARSEFNYSFIGAEDQVFDGDVGGASNYHGGGQHGGDRNAGFATITRWMVRQVSNLAQKLNGMAEGDGTVLDNTVMIMLNSMYSHAHRNNNIPGLLVGGGGGTLKTNGHVSFSLEGDHRQTRDLFYTVQNECFGAGVASFGDHFEGAPNRLLEEILA